MLDAAENSAGEEESYTKLPDREVFVSEDQPTREDKTVSAWQRRIDANADHAQRRAAESADRDAPGEDPMDPLDPRNLDREFERARPDYLAPSAAMAACIAEL